MERLSALARQQLGLFTRWQALDVGLSRSWIGRRTATRTWTKVLPGVYRAASTPETWRQRVLAGVLWAGEGAVASHRTAAKLHQLEGIRAPRDTDPIEITVPLGVQRRAKGYRVHQSRRLERYDRTTIDGIAATSLPRTLVDMSPGLDEGRLSVAIDSGLSRNTHLDVGFLRREHRRLATKGRRMSRSLGRLLDLRAPSALDLDSALERRFLAALKRAGLPQPAEHYDVYGNGGHVAELDFAYPRVRVGVQLHGQSLHRRYGNWQKDLAQQSELAALGWRLVLVTWEQLEKDEARVLRRVWQTLTHAVAEQTERNAASAQSAAPGTARALRQTQR